MAIRDHLTQLITWRRDPDQQRACAWCGTLTTNERHCDTCQADALHEADRWNDQLQRDRAYLRSLPGVTVGPDPDPDGLSDIIDWGADGYPADLPMDLVVKLHAAGVDVGERNVQRLHEANGWDLLAGDVDPDGRAQ